MAEKNSFVFYSEWAEQIAIIADAEGGSGVIGLFNAIGEYLATGEAISDMSPIVRLVFNQIRNQLDRDKAKYKKKVEQRTDAANKRWGKDDAEVCEPMRDDANECEPMRSEGDIGVRSKDKGVKDKGLEDDVSPNGDDIHSSTGSALALPAPQFVAETDPKKMTDKALEEEFEAIWLFYPRKAGKSEALRHYKAARRKGVDYDTIEDGVMRYADYAQGQDPQYIAMGSTWFNGHRWEDQYVRKKSELERLWEL
jgi:hypothetical protein